MSLTAAQQKRADLINNGVNESDLGPLDNAYKALNQHLVDRTAIFRKHQSAYAAVASNPAKHTDLGAAGSNHCMLLALGAEASETVQFRQAIYNAHEAIIKYAASGTDPALKKEAKGFLALLQANWAAEAEPYGFDDASYRNNSGRFLNAADMAVAAVLLGRDVRAIYPDGRANGFVANGMSPQLKNALGLSTYQPTKVIGNAPNPIYVRYNGSGHYHRFNDDAISDLVQADQNADIAVNALTDPQKDVDAAVVTLKRNFSNKTQQIDAYVSALQAEHTAQSQASAAAPTATTSKPSAVVAYVHKAALGASPSFGSSANKLAPPDKPYIADQIQALQAAKKEREVLKQNLQANTDIKKVNNDFVANLEKLHTEHIKAKRVLAHARSPERQKEAFKEVLYGASPATATPPQQHPVFDKTNVNDLNTKADSVNSFLFALGVDETEHANNFKQRDQAQAALEKAEWSKFQTADLVNQAKENLKKKEKLLELFKEKDSLNSKVSELRGTLRIKQEAFQFASQSHGGLTPAAAEAYLKEIDILAQKVNSTYERWLEVDDELRQNGFNILRLVQVERQLEDAKADMLKCEKDHTILVTAFERFQQKMTALKAQQDNGEGDVLNPWDVQWAAILRQEVIVVVKSDGTCVTYYPHIFTPDDLKGMEPLRSVTEAATLGMQCMTQIGFKITASKTNPITTVYVHQEEGALYRQFTAAGQNATQNVMLKLVEKVVEAEVGSRNAEKKIKDHLNGLNSNIHPNVIHQVEQYSAMYAAVAEGKDKILPSNVSPPKAHAWQTKQDKPAITVTAEVDIARDIHRQNMDTLLVLLVQGSSVSRQDFSTNYFGYSAAAQALMVISNNPPFDQSPAFYAKGLTNPRVTTGVSAAPSDDDGNRAFILELLKNELKAYVDLKGQNVDSALVKDYQAIIFALEEGIVPMNLTHVGLEDPPDSPLKGLIADIHARVAGKAAYVADVIDHQACTGRFGTEKDAIRGELHEYRSAVGVAKGNSRLPSFNARTAPGVDAPKRMTQSTYAGNTDNPRVVIRLKGVRLDSMLTEFNDAKHDTALTVEDGKRVRAKMDVGRLRMVLVDRNGQESPLTKAAWAKVETAATKIFADMAGPSATMVHHAKPRMR